MYTCISEGEYPVCDGMEVNERQKPEVPKTASMSFSAPDGGCKPDSMAGGDCDEETILEKRSPQACKDGRREQGRRRGDGRVKGSHCRGLGLRSAPCAIPANRIDRSWRTTGRRLVRRRPARLETSSSASCEPTRGCRALPVGACW